MLPPNATVGQLIYDADSSAFWMFNGTRWVCAMDPARGNKMWTVRTEKDILVLLSEFGIEATITRSQIHPGEAVIYVEPKNLILAAGVVSEMDGPTGIFLRVDAASSPL